MTKQEIRLLLRFFATLSLGVMVLVGCASQQDLETATGSAGPAAPNEAVEVEEIVVTANRRVRNVRNRPRGIMASTVANSPRDHAVESAALESHEPDEELWVIAMPSADDTSADDSNAPGSGAMVASFPDDIDASTGAAREVPLPLRHTSVDATINAYVSTVNVRQQFTNPFDTKIEAVYLFPLPEKAAVTEFLMLIGNRKIRGILREKEEAEAIYRSARSQGYQASLLVQHRPNVFEQKVANIEPGKSIDVDIRYFHTLAYDDG